MVLIRGIVLTVAAAVFLLSRPVSAVSPGDVVINELMWMGSSLNASDEWIELRNTTDAPVDLSGWMLTKLSGGETKPMLVLPVGSTISAGGFFLIANYGDDDANSILAVRSDLADSSVSLVNTKLQITLLDAAGQTIDVADDGSGRPLAGAYQPGGTWKSMERRIVPGDGTLAGSWRTASNAVGLKPGAELGTPGAENGNLPPEVVGLSDRSAAAREEVLFDVSESVDPDGDPLTFSWEFGDGSTGTGATPTHAYRAPGRYAVTVAATDGRAATSASAVVTVGPVAPLPRVGPRVPAPVPPLPPVAFDLPPTPRPERLEPVTLGLRFDELFVDPDGRDAGAEFIELLHVGDDPLSTAGWTITNLRRSFELPDLSVEPDERVVLQGEGLGIAIRNLGDTLYLLDPAGEIRDGVKYPRAKTGRSFSRFRKRWAWTEPSPAAENVRPASRTHGRGGEAGGLPELSIDEVRQRASGTTFRLEGTVVVPPGALSDRELLLGDATGTVVVRLDRELDLAPGDRLRLNGRRSTAREPRVLAKAEEVERLGSGEAVEALSATIERLSEDDLGAFVSLEGAVTATRASSFSLDDGTDQLSVRWPLARELERGRRVVTSGVVRSSGGRLRLVGIRVEPVGEPVAPLVAGASLEAAPEPVTLHGARPAPPRLGYVLFSIAGVLILARLWLQPRLA